VPGVPAHAWLRAYDLERPAAAPPLPEGAIPEPRKHLGDVEILGSASGPIDRRHDRYVFFARAAGAPGAVRVVFHTTRGDVEKRIEPEHSLTSRHRLRGVPWFILPAVGPPRSQVTSISVHPGR
jgi:hypothetical protein